MTRPDWCPPDVWDAAISFQYQEPGLCLANSQVEPTSRAILAERERCAAIADKHAEILRNNLARYEAIAVEGVAKEIRGAA